MKAKIEKIEVEREQSLSAADLLAQHIDRLHVQLFQEEEQRTSARSPDVGKLRKGLTQLNLKLQMEKKRREAAENEAKILVNENGVLAHDWERLHGRGGEGGRGRGRGRGQGRGVGNRRNSAKHSNLSLHTTSTSSDDGDGDGDGDSAVGSTVSGSYVKLPPEAFNRVVFTPAQSPTAAGAAGAGQGGAAVVGAAVIAAGAVVNAGVGVGEAAVGASSSDVLDRALGVGEGERMG